MLERLKKGIFKKRMRVAMGLSVTSQKPILEIHDSSDKNDKKSVGAK
jgi:hypothetical protein